MLEKYEVDEATVRADVRELLELLKSKNLIEGLIMAYLSPESEYSYNYIKIGSQW